MAKTRQILSFCDYGKCYKVIKYYGTTNPYRLYRTWYEYGNHRKLIAEYANFESVLYHLLQMNMPEFRKDVFC